VVGGCVRLQTDLHVYKNLPAPLLHLNRVASRYRGTFNVLEGAATIADADSTGAMQGPHYDWWVGRSV